MLLDNTSVKKLNLTLFLILVSLVSMAQLEYTTDNTTSLWDNPSLWTVNETWGSPTPGSSDGTTLTVNSSVSLVNVFGNVTVDEHMEVAGSSRVVISLDNSRTGGDTLTIDGNLSITGSGVVEVQDNGVLLIRGDLYMDGGGVLTSSGVVLVGGAAILTAGSSLQNETVSRGNGRRSTNNIYTADGVTTSGGASTNGLIFEGVGQMSEDHSTLSNSVITVQPVELLTFQGKPSGSSIQLEWVTAMEENFDFFTVERAGADRQFKAIGTVQGQGNSTVEVSYSFTDQAPIQGQALYRLKATDIDGSVEYHRIISVYYDGVTSTEIQVYPNPVSESDFRVVTHQFGVSQIMLKDMAGRTLLSQQAQPGDNQISLPHNVRPGAYLLILTSEAGEKTQQRIMVL